MGGQGPPIELPLQNITALHTKPAPTWVPQPNTRGTSDILYSCTFTLVLCVWNTIHPNIIVGEKSIALPLRKGLWLVGAVLFPELVVFFAFEEWTCARETRKALNEIAKQQGKELTYSMAYTFYIVMRGFRVNIRDADDNVTPLYITPWGMRDLAERNIYIHLPSASIRDKSKADSLAKGLVCVQVLWLLAEVIARKAASYPITLLELHTLVNILCALLLYSLWLSKPLGVEDPTVVDDQAFHDHLSSLKKAATNQLEKPASELMSPVRPYYTPLQGVSLYDRFTGSRRTALEKMLVILVVSSLYGGVHLAAWNSFFPTAIEHLLWQIASIASMAFPVLVIAIFSLAELCVEILKSCELTPAWTRNIKEWKFNWEKRNFTLFVLTGVVLIVPCRLFIVAESFISLRRVPVGVYATVPWSSYVPHL